VILVAGALGLASLLPAQYFGVAYGFGVFAAGESAGDVAPTADGGFVMTGAYRDYFWVGKVDGVGVLQWGRYYSNLVTGMGHSVQQTPDGGYIVVGTTRSFTSFPSPSALAFKLDSSGAVTWAKVYGTHDASTDSTPEGFHSIVRTADGGYLATGTVNESSTQYPWAVKLNSDGTIAWQNRYSGTGGTYLFAGQQTNDGGYIVAGGGSSSAAAWVAKLDSSGAISWQKTVGGGTWCVAYSVKEFYDTGAAAYAYIVAGLYQVGGNTDGWIAKLTAAGAWSWGRRIGNTSSSLSDAAYAVAPTGDGGFAVGGYENSFTASNDVFLAKYSSTGTLSWMRTYGGAYSDGASGSTGDPQFGLRQTADGGFAIGTSTYSYGPHPGSAANAWLIRADPSGTVAASCTATWAVDSAFAATVANGAATAAASAAPAADYIFAPVNSTLVTTDNCSTCATDAYEPDDSCGSTRAVAVPAQVQARNFCDDADDWLRLSACLGQTYTATTSNLGAWADTVLELYSSDCSTLLASNDNGSGGKASKITWTCPATGTYYLRARNADGTSGLNRGYDLTITGPTACAYWWEYWGGTGSEQANAVFQARDGGFVAAGATGSFGSGAPNGWLVKTDPDGASSWQRSYGGSGSDGLESIRQTADGGYLAAGSTNSAGAGGYDGWVMKLDGTGALSWQKAYGGAQDDSILDILPTSDGGSLAVGWTRSWGGGAQDLWALKLDASGAVTWARTLGGASNDAATSALEDASGDFVVGGYSASFSAYNDFWVIKLTAAGAVSWQKWFNNRNDYLNALLLAPDGGYVALGYAENGFGGFNDLWVLKLTTAGAPAWQKQYDYDAYDYINSAALLPDGRIAAAGYTNNSGDGRRNAYLALLDASTGALGNFRDLGYSTVYESIFGVAPTSDGGLVLGGWSNGGAVGNGNDLLIVKTDAAAAQSCTAASGSPVVTDTTATATNSSFTAVTTAPALTSTALTAAASAAVPTRNCWAGIPGEVSAPAAATKLRIDKASQVASWEAVAGATGYNLYRSTLAQVKTGTYTQTQMVCGVAGASTTLTDGAPPAGTVWAYVVTGRNGMGEGILGYQSSGTLRANGNPCP
jgi:uncharacterized delta-60 repeat protein